MISTGIAIVTLPAVARAGPVAGARIGRRNLAVAVVLMAGGAAALALAAPALIAGLLGAPFLPAVPLLRILLLGQVALGSTQVLHKVLRGQRRLRLPAVVETVGAMATARSCFAIPVWGALGAAWVSVCVYWPVMIVLCVAFLGSASTRPALPQEAPRIDLGEDGVAFPDEPS